MKRYKWNVLTFISNLFAFIEVSFLMWFGFSFMEVIAKNLSPNPQYCIINMFKIFGF